MRGTYSGKHCDRGQLTFDFAIAHMTATSHSSVRIMRVGRCDSFARLTSRFGKKSENQQAVPALYFAWYNFCRVHGTLTVTPAADGGTADHIWDVDKLLAAQHTENGHGTRAHS